MAFADPRRASRVALPFYRMTIRTREGEVRVDVESFLLQHALPRHACLLVERPVGGVDPLDVPAGVARARPFADAGGVLAALRRLLAGLEGELERAERERGVVRGAGRGLPGILAGLFAPRRPPRVRGDVLELRLAYTLCTDVFGEDLLAGASLSGYSLVYRVYEVRLVGGEVWVGGPRGRERRIMKVVEESGEARRALLGLAGLPTS